MPGHGRPQSLINQDLDRCQYFVGVIYDHWGSRPSSQHNQFTSGFEEEYTRAKERLASGLLKDMAVYFKEIPEDRLRDPGISLSKVLEFRARCFAEKDALYKEYVDLADFERHLRAKLMEIGWIEHASKLQIDPPANASGGSGGSKQEVATTGSDAGLLGGEARDFLREITLRPADWERTNSFDVARLRLLALSLSRPGNDQMVIGNHDANLLFRARRETSFTMMELKGLASCGIQGLSHQNVPLWYWLAEVLKPHHDPDYLAMLAWIGDDRQQPNAIRILRLLGLETHKLKGAFEPEVIVTRWVSDETNETVFNSAMEYLRDCGSMQDVAILEEKLEKATTSRRDKLGQTIVGIYANKAGEAQALTRLADIGIDDIDDDLVQTLFNRPSSLNTKLLRRCLTSGVVAVRRRAVALLAERNEIELDEANILLSDTDYHIRCQAAEALNSLGRPLDETLAEKALTIESSRNVLAFGLGALRENDTTYLNIYKRNRIAELNLEQLRAAIDVDHILIDDEVSVLFARHTRKVQNEIRNYMDDEFREFLDVRLRRLRDRGASPALVERMEKLRPFLKEKLMASAVNALCSLGQRSDLHLIRRAVDRIKIEASVPLISYLGKYGDWSDKDRILSLAEYSNDSWTTLSIPTPKFVQEKARALLSIGRSRIADIFEAGLDGGVRRAIIENLHRRDLIGLSNDFILGQLNQEDDKSRALWALRCCETLPKARLSELLNRYIDGDGYRYYNSIHWLDLGVSYPLRLARIIAKKQLSIMSI